MVKKAPVKREESSDSSDSSANEELLEQIFEVAQKLVMYGDSS
jgi:hypothetical protein